MQPVGWQQQVDYVEAVPSLIEIGEICPKNRLIIFSGKFHIFPYVICIKWVNKITTFKG
jgi:hypothetical protein